MRSLLHFCKRLLAVGNQSTRWHTKAEMSLVYSTFEMAAISYFGWAAAGAAPAEAAVQLCLLGLSAQHPVVYMAAIIFSGRRPKIGPKKLHQHRTLGVWRQSGKIAECILVRGRKAKGSSRIVPNIFFSKSRHRRKCTTELVN